MNIDEKSTKNPLDIAYKISNINNTPTLHLAKFYMRPKYLESPDIYAESTVIFFCKQSL